MNKTFNVNISGRIFTIETNAYDLLSKYLDTMHDAFRHSDDGREVLVDIENRISEIFNKINSEGEHIISLSDVEQVITQVGSPDEIYQEIDAINISDSNSKIAQISVNEEYVTEKIDAPMPPKVRHRLYRDNENKVLGGVGSGLAHYLNIDPVWVRIVFVVLLFASFSTFLLVYLILWIIIPVATTPLQKMEMYGEPFTIQNIGKSVVTTFEQTGKYLRGEKQQSTDKQDAKIATTAKAIAYIARVLIVVIIAILVPLLILLGISFCCSLFLMIVDGTDIWPNVSEMLTIWLPDAIVYGRKLRPLLSCVSFLSIIIGIPVFLLLRTILTDPERLPMSISWRITLLSIWGCGVVGFLISAAVYYGMPPHTVVV